MNCTKEKIIGLDADEFATDHIFYAMKPGAISFEDMQKALTVSADLRSHVLEQQKAICRDETPEHFIPILLLKRFCAQFPEKEIKELHWIVARVLIFQLFIDENQEALLNCAVVKGTDDSDSRLFEVIPEAVLVAAKYPVRLESGYYLDSFLTTLDKAKKFFDAEGALAVNDLQIFF